MASGAHTGDSLPTNLHSPATPKAATGFGSYAEYLAKLERSPVKPSHTVSSDELWLASFDGDGHFMEWNYCYPHSENITEAPKELPGLDESGVRHHTRSLSPHGFRTVLQTPDEHVAYRVIIVSAGRMTAIDSNTQDILGLGLDLGPEPFEFAQNCVENSYFEDHRVLPRPWHKVPPALHLGKNVLYIPKAGPEKESKTAILFLGSTFHCGNLGPVVSTSSRMFPPKRPSQIPERSNDRSDQPTEYYESTWLVQRFITSGIGSDNSFGNGNFLYVCLAALVELQLCTLPSNVPYIGMHGLESQVELEYCGEYRWGSEGPLVFAADPSMIWARLRKDVDDQRTTMRWITRFFRKHFDYSNQAIQAAFDETMECFKFRLQDLEQSESRLRDHLAAEATSKSIRMAEMSIRESKRVMLLTAFAFVFLPISLASSVYGMNVQQINGTGHSIRAFVITGIAMCASSVLLWVTAAAFQSYKARLESNRGSGRGEYHGPWYEKAILGIPPYSWRYSWQRVRWKWDYLREACGWSSGVKA